MRVLAVLFGVILLLPGLCSAGFMLQLIPQTALAIALRGIGGIGAIFGEVFGPIGLLWLVCFAISAGGVVMIRSALREPKPSTAPRDEGPPGDRTDDVR